MKQDPVIDALTEQVACYRRLAKLAAIQHDHVQHSRTDELLGVLQSRQQVLDQVAQHEKVIGPIKQQWAQYAGNLDAALRGRAESLMAETRKLLEQITTADKRDVLALQQRKLNIGKKINKTATARQVNKNYAVAAYGTAKPRMDVQM
jgi:uncharacterized protein YjbJ (UPF0337 family)